MIYFIIAVFVMAVDQFTKWLVVRFMTIGESIPIWEGLVYLTSHRNRGAAFGILQNQRLLFIVITIVVVIGVIYYLWKVKDKRIFLSLALALILGGAVGNFIDRLFRGEVVDFFDVKIPLGSFYYDFPIFNVADSALVIGVILMLIDTIRDGKNEMREAKSG
jgi:signal peptidase II